MTRPATGRRRPWTANGITSAYAYPATSNQLSSIAPSGGSTGSFTYDAAGNITSDSGASSGPAMTYRDAEAGSPKRFRP